MRIPLVVALALSSLLFVSCDKEEDNPVAPPTAPTMSGTWDWSVTTPVGTMTGITTLTESNGQLSGTFNIAGATGPIAGTCTQAGEVTLAGQDASTRILIQGTVNTARTSFTGTFQMWDITTTPETYLGLGNMTATKRS
jgi:hypothetical protein